MSTISVRAGAIAFVTVLVSLANAPTALGGLPEHSQVAEFQDDDTAEFPFEDFGFGEAVAIRNELAFIGVPRAHDNGHVIVLNLTATGWKQVQRLTAPNPLAQSDFGRVITFRDGVLVVGGANAAYAFKRGGNGLFKFTQTLTPPQLMAQAIFRSPCVTKPGCCSQARSAGARRALCTSSSGTRPACSCAEGK